MLRSHSDSAWLDDLLGDCSTGLWLAKNRFHKPNTIGLFFASTLLLDVTRDRTRYDCRQLRATNINPLLLAAELLIASKPNNLLIFLSRYIYYISLFYSSLFISTRKKFSLNISKDKYVEIYYFLSFKKEISFKMTPNKFFSLLLT